ncbi:GNAT family N-acetyltransferase [Secundilactobacillus folii]|uniref:GNAT family N-acetyltransferase n=1 Tax=Secundilactobacillus folii TaxID=2678357 RepID=A0A7X2XVX8_9LACO|nr:GNAT family N-acetyltransferase [Secundilactobacillus folii]MTV81868.1 GNAT family N-acetyltransferase [Secundilactobacillus folii]
MMENIQTKRLLLRPFVESDLADFYAFVGDAQSAHSAGFQYAHSESDAAYMLKSLTKKKIFAIVELRTQRVIGSIGLYPRMGNDGLQEPRTADLGYVLNRSYWGQGYMTEAGQALIKALFDQNELDTIWASHLQDNQRSKRVIQKLGFHYVDAFTHSQTALFQPGATELIYRRDRE